jgi:predicted membrane protein
VKILEFGLIWEGSLALCIIIGTYFTHQWYKTKVGRYILTFKVAFLASVVPRVIHSITQFDRIRSDDITVLSTGIAAILLSYGAYAFIDASKHKDDYVVVKKTELTPVPSVQDKFDRWDDTNGK